MWRLFRRLPKGWLSITEYRKLREREMKRNPDRVAQELKQASLWSVRVAERKLNEAGVGGRERKAQDDAATDLRIETRTREDAASGASAASLYSFPESKRPGSAQK